MFLYKALNSFIKILGNKRNQIEIIQILKWTILKHTQGKYRVNVIYL